MSFISESLRSAQSATELETVTILDIQTEIGFTELRFAHHNASGNDLLHLVTPDGKYLSIKIGAKASTAEGDELAQMKHLINSNLIYTGVNNGNRWFTFGRKADLKPTKVVKYSELGMKLNAAAGVGVM